MVLPGNVTLIMPDAFHLGWLGSTRRTFHLAEAFKSLGFKPTLLMGRESAPALQRPLSKEFPGEVLQTDHSGDYPAFFEGSRFLKRGWRATWKARGVDFYFEKLSMGWADSLDLDEVIPKMSCIPDILWGMGGGYLDGAVAAFRLSQRLGVPWVMELHDPPHHAGLGQDLGRICRRMERLVAAADLVVVNTRTYNEEISRRFNKAASLVKTLYLSYEGEAGWSQPGNDRMTVVYAGSLVGARGLSPFIRGMHQAVQARPELRDRIRLEMYGLGEGFEHSAKEATALGIGEAVAKCGYVDGPKLESILAHCDGIVLVQSPGQSAFEIPGKIFECMKHGKRIFPIMPPCETAEMLVEAGLGTAVRGEDTDQIAGQILEAWDAWVKDGFLPCLANWEFIHRFSKVRLKDDLATILNEVHPLEPIVE